MFIINPNITDLKVKERTIFKILYSMNSHQVATPEMNVEDARCYILFFSEGPSLSSYIGLYLPNTDRKFFYSYSSNPFPYEAVSDVENEARAFAEDMGFLLDEISLSGMAAEDRNRWIEEQFIFGFKKPELKPEEKPAEAKTETAPSATQAAETTAPAATHVPGAAPPVAPAPQETVAPSAAVQPAPPPQPIQPQPAQQTAQPQVQIPQQYVQPQSQAQTPQPVQPQMQPQVHIHIQQPAPPQPQQQQPAPRKPSPSQQKPQPARRQTKQAAPAEPHPQVEPLAEEAAPQSIRPDDLIQEAVKSGVMRQPKQKLTKDMRSTTGVVARDKEALARLMASF